MLSLLPSREQWRRWSKPKKYQFVGTSASVASLLVAVLALLNDRVQQGEQSGLQPSNPNPVAGQLASGGFEVSRVNLVQKLSDASLCLTARIHRDSLFLLEPDCRMNVEGLRAFFQSYAPIFATQPYSGAEDAQKFANWVENETKNIDGIRSQAELIAYQRRTGINLAQLGYYLCGFEWYLRSAPPVPLPPMQAAPVAMYQAAWLNWNEATKSDFQGVPFLITAAGEIDDDECSSFIDVLD